MDKEKIIYNPSIGIIIPAYNAEKTITRTLMSIACQTDLLGVKVLVVDDKSIDETIFMANHFFRKHLYDNFKEWQVLSCRENGGPGVARQTGLNYMTETMDIDYIMFIDADDVINPIAIEHIKTKLQTEPYVYNSNFIKTSPDGKLETFDGNNATWFHGKVYSKRFLQLNKLSIPPVRINEDSGFNMAVAELTNRVIRDDFCWYYWLSREGSITNNILKKDQEIYLEFFQSILYGLGMILRKKESNRINILPANLVVCYKFYMELIHSRKIERLENCEHVLSAIMHDISIKTLLEDERFIRDVQIALKAEGPIYIDCKYNFKDWCLYITSKNIVNF